MSNQALARGRYLPYDKADKILAAVAACLAVAVIASGAYLGYSIYTGRALERAATPASRAIETFYEQVSENPESAALRVRLGEALAAAGRNREAVRELETALKIDPEHTGAYLVLGYIAMSDADYEAAQAYLIKVIELSEGSGFETVNQRREMAFFYLGEAAYIQGQHEQAVAYFKEALRVRRDNAATYFNLAMALKGMDEIAGAIENLENALLFDPEFAEAHYEMGQIYLSQEDRVNAATHFAKAAELVPDHERPAEALASMGLASEWAATARTAMAEGDLDRALEAVQIARALDSDDVGYVRLHASITEERGSNSAAIEIYREALEIDPDDPEAKAALKRLGEDL